MKTQCALFLVWLACSLAAMAYRPFISTDADVAEKGFSEIEFGIMDFANHRGANTVAVPSLRYNLGFARDWEFTLEGEVQVYDSTRRRAPGIIEPELAFKYVFLECPLQEARSPLSLALELSALLPETRGHSGWGMESVLIGSWRTGDFTWHLNGGAEWRRESLEATLLWGLIVEHPIAEEWRVGIEVTGESARRATAENSALIGLLWEHRKVTYDAGIRFGLSKAAPDVAFTLGLTFKF
jgi:hypothetical protein